MSSSKGHLEDRDSRSPEKGKFIKKKHKSRSPRRHGKRRSRGSSIDSNSSTDSSPDYKKSKKQRRKGNSSDNNASSTSSPDCKKLKKHKSKKKHKKHDKKKKHKKSKKKSKEKKNLSVTADVQEQTTSAVANEDSDVIVGPDPELLKAKAMAPMTKEEWDKQQSVVRRVYDEESGRYRLIKGGGEVIEEIVSLQRHKEINKKATQGDGAYFQSVLGLNSQK